MAKPSRVGNKDRSHYKSRRTRKNHKTTTPSMAGIQKKRNRGKDLKNIKSLFNSLRRESLNSIKSCDNLPGSKERLDSSILISDSTLENTVIEVHSKTPRQSGLKPQSGHEVPTTSSPTKRKSDNVSAHSPKRQRRDKFCESPLIIIDDNELQRGSFSGHPTHSTPINQKRKSSSNYLKNTSPIQAFNEDVANLTREINKSSYVTIDLTTGTNNNTSRTVDKEEIPVPVINLADESEDCLFVPSDTNVSTISGESNVTVLNMPQRKKEEVVHKYINRIASLDSSGKVLESVLQKIFNGCKMARSASAVMRGWNQEPANVETAEDMYIKEVILGQNPSRNSIGSNIFNPERPVKRTGLRVIIIDGSNVAMEHGRGRVFSVKGLKICIDFFLNRGHSMVKAFVPRYRCKFGKSSDPRLLDALERQGLVIYTPSREIQGRMITSYDDRYIVQCATAFDAVIVSGDNYRDLLHENPRWRYTIENRLLLFNWVNDMLIFPKDPLGRHGPTLEQFLKYPD